MQSDLEIARQAKLKDIREIAAQYDIEESELRVFGTHLSKVPLSILERLDCFQQAPTAVPYG